MKIKRIPFLVKLLPENHAKLKEESEKLGLSMSALTSMLISSYNSLDVKFDKPQKKGD